MVEFKTIILSHKALKDLIMKKDNEWIPCNDWKELPEGTWLTKIDKDRKPYNIAEASKNVNGVMIIIVGNHFSWDMGNIIAYKGFDKYEATKR